MTYPIEAARFLEHVTVYSDIQYVYMTFSSTTAMVLFTLKLHGLDSSGSPDP
jgi:hypothetical protein